ncbi:MAG: hypothetical protein ACQESG_04950 [Nanobdellota archaeon]
MNMKRALYATMALSVFALASQDTAPMQAQEGHLGNKLVDRFPDIYGPESIDTSYQHGNTRTVVSSLAATGQDYAIRTLNTNGKVLECRLDMDGDGIFNKGYMPNKWYR